jgi:SAM-dependent methyltransferase
MVALGLLERRDDTYRNSPTADLFLAGRPQADLRPLLRFWDRVSYPAWQDLAGSLGRGPRREIFDLDDELQKIASAGIEAVLAGPAAALAHTYGFAAHRRLLDVGGGTGSWSIAAAAAHPGLAATVVELPVVAAVAKTRVAEAGLGDRIEVVTGDVMGGELPGGHDVVLVANLVHYWSAEQNRQLLRRIRAACPAAHLLLADFWTDPTHTRPTHAALMAGEFAVHLENGDVYSVDEARGWLRDTGWRFVEHRELAGPQSLIVAAAA